MKAAFHERYGPPDVVELREVDKPAIEDHQVLVRVHASSRQPGRVVRRHRPVVREAVRRRASAGPRIRAWARISRDGSRPSAATSRSFKPGDEVFGTSGAAWADYAAAREVRLVPKPANVSFEEAAAVPIAALTALQALRDHGAGAARAEGADQRRVGRRRHVRRADRQGARRGRDGRVLAAERRAGAGARRRPRRRLHAGGLHEARRPPRRPDRYRRQQAFREAQARPDAGGDGRDRRGEVSGPRARALSAT